MTLPLALMPWLTPPFMVDTADGLVPNEGGKIWTYEAGSPSTAQATYQDQDGDTAHSNPITIDANGSVPSDAIFLLPTGYRVLITDADAVPLVDLAFVEDVGSAFLDQSAVIQSQGTDATTSPYIVTDDDNTVTVSSATDPFVVQLPAAADRGTPLIIKNLSAIAVRVTPDSAETIEGIAAYFAIGSAVSPNFPTITLLSDGVSNWILSSSHGL